MECGNILSSEDKILIKTCGNLKKFPARRLIKEEYFNYLFIYLTSYTNRNNNSTKATKQLLQAPTRRKKR